eukprot:TRINITY_DN13530_c0_g1_i5.p1 TRINITY_DN13530_c0_g1~~TRINITY_DN13530_c0_g1_i5.p1  ORF type:complete len:275 (-),score=25.77 TRINITY_DN13530_c0_g1_i5:239-1063(-)
MLPQNDIITRCAVFNDLVQEFIEDVSLCRIADRTVFLPSIGFSIANSVLDSLDVEVTFFRHGSPPHTYSRMSHCIDSAADAWSRFDSIVDNLLVNLIQCVSRSEDDIASCPCDFKDTVVNVSAEGYVENITREDTSLIEDPFMHSNMPHYVAALALSWNTPLAELSTLYEMCSMKGFDLSETYFNLHMNVKCGRATLLRVYSSLKQFILQDKPFFLDHICESHMIHLRLRRWRSLIYVLDKAVDNVGDGQMCTLTSVFNAAGDDSRVQSGRGDA